MIIYENESITISKLKTGDFECDLKHKISDDEDSWKIFELCCVIEKLVKEKEELEAQLKAELKLDWDWFEVWIIVFWNSIKVFLR